MPCILILVKSETNTCGTTLSVCQAEKCEGVWPGKYDYAAVLQMLPVCTLHGPQKHIPNVMWGKWREVESQYIADFLNFHGC